MNLFNSTTIPASEWIMPAIVLVLALFFILLWTYWRAHKFIVGNKTAFIFKLLGILILAIFLTEPMLSSKRAKSGANMFIVVADNSRGMNIQDSQADKTRAETLKDILLAGKTSWLSSIAEDFQLRQYIFDSRLQRTTEFSELNFDGKASSINSILRTLAQRFSSKPLAGILLLSDGSATDMTDGASWDFTGLPPVYPVLIGGSQPQKDLSIENVTVTQSAFEDAPVAIQANTGASGYSGKSITVKLIDETGQAADNQTWKISKDQQVSTSNFRLKPEKTGILFYNLEVTEDPQAETPGETASSSEATIINNKRTFVIDRGGGPYRILYVSGRPNWEYKFLRRAIDEDKQIDLVALLRVAKREPKFNWLGRAGETVNPLFRGFDNADPNIAEQYDQPVLVRLNTRDQNELSSGFPTTAKELFEYHAIILDDIEAAFFTAEQMDLIRKFVAERGGGFMMLGGMESFEQGKYEHTAIQQILPVHLDKSTDAQVAGKMLMELTREGMLMPWARLRDNQTDEEQRLLEMTSFSVLNRLSSVKAGSNVVATINNALYQSFPALVVQRYGNGRAASLTIGDIWRWGMKTTKSHEDMDKFWRQMFRWMVADVPEKISIQAMQQSDQSNQSVELQVTVRDKEFELLNNVSVAIEIRDPENQTIKLNAEPKLEQSGVFKATYIPHLNGGYIAKAVVTDLDGTELGSSETGWASDLDDLEFRSIKTNRALLEQIARQSGGRVIEAAELSDFARSLPNQNVPISETWTRPLWDSRPISLGVFLVILICFAGEWAFRRWRGMP
jgi:uncharacterized membrane protein